MKPIKKLNKAWERWLNTKKMRTKVLGLFVFCVLLPLLLTDGIVMYSLIKSDNAEREYDDKNMVNSIRYLMSDIVSYSENISMGIYMNRQVNRFLIKEYEDAYDFYLAYYDLLEDSFFESLTGFENTKITLYADNDTLVEGGHVLKTRDIADEQWYQELMMSESPIKFFWTYEKTSGQDLHPKRKIYYLMRLDYSDKQCDKIVKIELDYSTIVRKLVNLSYDNTVYICQNGRIIMSNDGTHNNLLEDYSMFNDYRNVSYRESFKFYGEEYQIIIMKDENPFISYFEKNGLYLIILLFANIILPLVFIMSFNRTIVGRIAKLENAFSGIGKDELTKIEYVEGTDEIGQLMENYNVMADRINELIQTVYKGKLTEQESNIARKNAELQALHSQINPHFLFNALESIRMHSILRKEDETAEMVEKLALMERQMVDWGKDQIEIAREMKFVDAYLGLQKYRFGDRLMYDLQVDKECERLMIPKLTIVTFVENACVHGIESKSTQGWIFVRIYKDFDSYVIEVEDTGGGIGEEELGRLRKQIENLSIEDLKNKKHIGVLNAILRVKMIYDNKVRITIDSEEGVGTLVQLRI